MIKFLKNFFTALVDAYVDAKAKRHALAVMTRNPDGSMDIVCNSGCRSRVRVIPYPGDITKTLGDRVRVESTNCPLYIEFRRRHGQDAAARLN